MAADVRRNAGPAADSPSTDAGRLYERYSTRILAYCLHALRDRGEAEDAVQTTFLQAHRALERGVLPEHEFAWLHTIAKNVCRTQKRTAARRATVTGVDLDAFPAQGGDADERDVLRGLGDALWSMPDSQRRALLMREWHGLSSAEVAMRMGLSAPATYALLTRARRSLADALTAKGRSALGLNVWPLFLRLKAFFAGGAAKVATATAVAAVVSAGGATIAHVADRPNVSRSDERSVSAGTTATPVFVTSARVSEPRASAARRGTRSRELAPTRTGDVPVYVSVEPDGADAPTTVPPAIEAGVPAETAGATETTIGDGTIEPIVQPVFEPLVEVPLPEVDLGAVIDVVPEIVPELGPLDDAGLTQPVQVPPAPEPLLP